MYSTIFSPHDEFSFQTDRLADGRTKGQILCYGLSQLLLKASIIVFFNRLTDGQTPHTERGRIYMDRRTRYNAPRPFPVDLAQEG